MAFRPKFDNYFKDAWPYDGHEGVGIKLSGYPNDISAFIDLLQGESCNPVATHRILEELKEKGVKYTTLMAGLNFNRIGDELKELNVAMEIIPPVNGNKLNNLDLDYLAFDLYQQKKIRRPIEENEKDEINKRLIIFQQSMNKNTHHFGPYDDNEEIARHHMDLIKRKNR